MIKVTHRNRLSTDTSTHLVKANAMPEEAAEFTVCGKRLSSLSACCVNTFEAATCTTCIRLAHSAQDYRPGLRELTRMTQEYGGYEKE